MNTCTNMFKINNLKNIKTKNNKGETHCYLIQKRKYTKKYIKKKNIYGKRLAI